MAMEPSLLNMVIPSRPARVTEQLPSICFEWSIPEPRAERNVAGVMVARIATGQIYTILQGWSSLNTQDSFALVQVSICVLLLELPNGGTRTFEFFLFFIFYSFVCISILTRYTNPDNIFRSLKKLRSISHVNVHFLGQ